MASLKYNLARTSGKKTALVAIIRHRGKSIKAYPGVSVEPQCWENKRQRVKMPGSPKDEREINERLEKFKNTVLGIAIQLGRLPSQKELKPPKTGIFKAIEAYQKGMAAKRRAKTSIKGYQTLAKNITKFHKQEKREEIEIREIGKGYMEAFATWLIETKCADSHTSKLLRLLRTVLKKEKVATDWAESETPKERFRDEIYLTEQEINQLYQLDLSQNSRLSRIRDVFLLACYTGQRYSDLSQIGNSNGMMGATQKKSSQRVLVPVKAALAEILARHPEGIKIPTNQEINREIKTVCQLAGIREIVQINQFRGGQQITLSAPKYEFVTSHTGRRSFCTNAILAGIPAQAVMKFSGHKTYKEFEKYIRASQHDVARHYREHPFFK